MDTVTNKKKTTSKKTPKAGKSGYGKEMYLSWYELMLRIRKFEERALMMYGQQKIRGFCHVYIGQEAIAAGLESAIRREDAIVTAYRQHGSQGGRTGTASGQAPGCQPEPCALSAYGTQATQR